MDILTLELFEVTISEALREIQRAVEAHPAMPLRILPCNDPMLRHNIQRLLERLGRSAVQRQDGSVWRIEVAGSGLPGSGLPHPPVPDPPAPERADLAVSQPADPGRPDPGRPAPGKPDLVKPLLVTCSHLGQGSKDIGRRLLLGVLRELDPAVPWVGLALEGLALLEDPQALALLERLQARGTAVRISRESQLFPLEPGPFEIMEDSRWQRLAGRGDITIL